MFSAERENEEAYVGVDVRMEVMRSIKGGKVRIAARHIIFTKKIVINLLSVAFIFVGAWAFAIFLFGVSSLIKSVSASQGMISEAGSFSAVSLAGLMLFLVATFSADRLMEKLFFYDGKLFYHIVNTGIIVALSVGMGVFFLHFGII